MNLDRDVIYRFLNILVTLGLFVFAIAVYVGCISDPVISVRVLRLSHNNSVNYS